MFLICNSKIADLLDSKTVDETNVKYGSRSRGYLNRNHLKVGNLQIRILYSVIAIKAVSNSPRELTITATRAAAKCNDK